MVALFLRDYHSLDFSADLVRDKRVFITGASRGIGRQAALHYARLGARIVITGRDEEALKKVGLVLERNRGVRWYNIRLGAKNRHHWQG